MTSRILNVRGGYHPSEIPHSVLIGDGLPVRLAGPGGLSLRMVLHYRLADGSGAMGSWKVRTAAYYYSLDDSSDREVISYHWHPQGRSPVQFPHLHIGPGAACKRAEIITAHFPTGRVSIPEFLQLAITDFRVEPLRSDWSTVFAEARRNFEAY